MDRLRKKSISVPCYKTCTAQELAWIYFVYVYCHHGTSEHIVFDYRPQFISDFWGEFCQILEIKITLSTAHKATTDEQTEIINQYLD